MSASTLKAGAAGLTVRIHEPFTVCQADEANDPGRCRIHPHLTHLPGGRLVMTTNIDGDISGAESLAYASDDGGTTWRDYPAWPNAAWAFTTLDAQHCLAVSSDGFYVTGEKGVYHWGIRRSHDGGLAWGSLETARVEFPLDVKEALDPLDPPERLRAEFRAMSHLRRFPAEWQAIGRVPQPARYERELWERFGRRRIPASLTNLFRVSASEVLAFLYMCPRIGQPSITICLATEDGGRTWRHRSTPGAHDPRFATHGYLRHALDGLCEPSCARLATGELFLLMRLGSFHPLCSTCSADEGRTWAPQADQRPGCYYAGWPARPISVHGILPTVLTLPDGTLALCTGRPDVTLSFSFDNGYHWPWTYRFLEDNKPEEQGTYNNTMVQVAPNRLLLMYDHGGNSGKIPEYSGPRRIVGHFIDVGTAR